MSEPQNQIAVWIEEAPRLLEMIENIAKISGDPYIQADLAFDHLADMYNLDKSIEETSSERKFQIRSLFEEHTLLKFLEPDLDPRGLIMTAAFHLVNGLGVDYEDVAQKKYGRKIPENCMIALRGERLNGEVVFPQEEEKSWVELGCKMAVKI